MLVLEAYDRVSQPSYAVRTRVRTTEDSVPITHTGTPYTRQQPESLDFST